MVRWLVTTSRAESPVTPSATSTYQRALDISRTIAGATSEQLIIVNIKGFERTVLYLRVFVRLYDESNHSHTALLRDKFRDK